MVTVSLGSEVSGISKASGGRLSRRLTLTVVEAMLARDWWEETEGVLRRGGLGDHSTHLPFYSLFCHVLSLGLGPCSDSCLQMGLWGSVSPSVARWGSHGAWCSPTALRSR